MSDPAIRVTNLGKRYRLGEREPYRMLREALQQLISAPLRSVRQLINREPATDYVWALRRVGFEVQPGEVLGVIGRNGAGKTTLLKLLSRITEPTEGDGVIRGTVGSLLEVGTGFHPELTGRDNVFLNGAILGMPRSETQRKFDEIVQFSGIERFIDTPVKRYSSGMQVRLAFAVAAHLETDILLIDEVLAVGDAEFQKRCMRKMESVGSEGRTVVFISHSMPAILRLCPRVLLLDGGGVVADGPAHQTVKTYLETGYGTTAKRQWNEPKEAPGGDRLRLKAVRVLSEAGKVTEAPDIHKPIDIEVEYWKLSSESFAPFVTIALTNDDGVRLFTSSDVGDTDLRTPEGKGIGRRVCRIPPNLLAEAQIFVAVDIGGVPLPRLEVRESDVVAFRVVDHSGTEGVRGSYVRDWPGVVRPKLDWSAEFDPHSPSAQSPN